MNVKKLYIDLETVITLLEDGAHESAIDLLESVMAELEIIKRRDGKK